MLGCSQTCSLGVVSYHAQWVRFVSAKLQPILGKSAGDELHITEQREGLPGAEMQLLLEKGWDDARQ